MLSKDEELRLALIIFTLGSEDWELQQETYLWLAEKLKEVNAELKLQSDNSDHCRDHCICLVCMK